MDKDVVILELHGTIALQSHKHRKCLAFVNVHLHSPNVENERTYN